jgi:V/A-type H+-transporting ATPase subunit C
LSDDFGYLNARIRSRRSRLLHEGFFHEALNLGFPEMVKVLGESIYGSDLTGDALADVDRAVTAHLNRSVADLPYLVSGKAREAVSLLLMRTDLANIKTIIRGKKAEWPADEIIGHLGVGTLPKSLYNAFIEAPDVASLAQLLSLPKHPLAKALREASAVARDPLELEVSLDRTFYTAMLRRARELDQPYLADFVCFEVDALNLATGLKLSTVGFKGEANRFFLPGGHRVVPTLFQRLADGEVAALEELGNTDFRRVAEVRDLATLERGLRCSLLAKAREGAKDVLGAGLVIDYIQRKQWEAGRVRLLARRAYYNLPPAGVQPEVFCE